jgi:uncharacterized membrane protein
MNEFVVPELFIGGMALTVVVLWAAAHEYFHKNTRDAKLLATVGTLGLLGSAATLL